MGRMAATIVSSYADLGELVIADLDLQAAEQLVAELAPTAKTNLRAARIDVTDTVALQALLQDLQVVLNTTGPFYRLGTAVLEAAITARCHYMDICDDWEPTTQLLAFNDKAKAAGVLAIIGLGASPGISNLLARLACDRLDQVDNLYTAWPADAGAGDFNLSDQGAVEVGVSAAIIHWVQQMSGSIEVIEQGRRVSGSPLVPIAIDYPGLGAGTAYTVGHPEPITLHERMNVRGSSANLMVLKASSAVYLDQIRREVDAGRLSVEDAALELTQSSGAMSRLPRALSRNFFQTLTTPGPGALPGFFAFAQGERDGQALRIGVHVNSIPKDMAEATSTPLALGLRQLLDGQLEVTGVHPPETVVNVESFFDGLARVCKTPHADMGELVVVSEAPL